MPQQNDDTQDFNLPLGSAMEAPSEAEQRSAMPDNMRQRMEASEYLAAAGDQYAGGTKNQTQMLRIHAVMQERWFKKEFEGFEEQHLNNYNQKLQQIDQSLTEKFGQIDAGTYVGPDGKAMSIDPNTVMASRLKANLLGAHTQEIARVTDNLMHEGGRYGNGNPLIAKRLSDINAAHVQGISQLVNPERFLKGEKGLADIGVVQAQRKGLLSEASLRDRTDPNLRNAGDTKAEFDQDAAIPSVFLRKHGSDDTISYMATPGNAWTGVEYATRLASIEGTMRAQATQDKDYAKSIGVVNGEVVDKEAYAAAMNSKKSEAKALAMWEFLDTGFAGNEQFRADMRSKPELARWEPHHGGTPAPARTSVLPSIKRTLGEKDLAEYRTKAEDGLQEELETIAGNGSSHSKQTILQAGNKWIDENVQPESGDPKAVAQANSLRKTLSNYLGKNWDHSHRVRRVTRKPNFEDTVRDVVGSEHWFSPVNPQKTDD